MVQRAPYPRIVIDDRNHTSAIRHEGISRFVAMLGSSGREARAKAQVGGLESIVGESLVIICQIFVAARHAVLIGLTVRGEEIVSEHKVKRDQLPSATGGIARQAYSRAKATGIALEPLLTRAGLDRRVMEDARLRLKVRSQIAFLNLASEALDDDLLGFHLATVFDLRKIGLLYYVLASSETLIDALWRAARYSSLVNDGIVQKCRDGQQIGMQLSYVGISRHLDRHQIEYWMTALLRMCRQLTGLRLVPSQVRMAHFREGGGAEISEFFGANIEFGATDDEIMFAAEARRLPIVNADPYLNKLLVAYCEEALSRRQSVRGSFRSRVENIVVPLLPHGKVRIDQVARRLGVSQRTLARRLSMEGLTFSDLLEDLRSDLASRYLDDDNLSVSQIAWLLGYQEVAAFSGAFKRWTGKSPREARSQLSASER